MSVLINSVYVIFGMIIGLVAIKFLFKTSKKDMDVEQAIATLKDKGYYININVTPEREVR